MSVAGSRAVLASGASPQTLGAGSARKAQALTCGGTRRSVRRVLP
jgi:hypothetical protein